jgi:SAM-dependent methyltransferase
MAGITEQRRFYDARFASFDYPSRLELERASAVIDLMRHVTSYTRICDLGCGSGWMAGVLSHFGQTVGVELSNVQRAQARFPNCEFISADILEWDHPSEAFDLVVSVEVIEHIPFPAQSTYLRIAHDLLQPGGHLILTTPIRKTMNAIPGGGRTWSNQPIEDWLDKAALVALLRGAGFEVKRSTSLVLGVGNMGVHRVVNSPKLNRVLKTIGLSGLWQRAALKLNYGLHLAVLAEKPMVPRS